MTARLLKVMVQPVFVVDDGDELTEVKVQPVTLTAAQWRALDPAGWASQGAAQVEAQLPPTSPRTCSETHPQYDQICVPPDQH